MVTPVSFRLPKSLRKSAGPATPLCHHLKSKKTLSLHSASCKFKLDLADKGEVIRKALEIYITAQDAKDKGLVLGLVDPTTRMIKTEFIGLWV